MRDPAKTVQDASKAPRERRALRSNLKFSKADSEALARLPVYLLETTWRVAVPILVFSIGGYKLDQRFDSRPWLSLTGLFLSLFFSTLLVYRYIKANFPDAFDGGKP